MVRRLCAPAVRGGRDPLKRVESCIGSRSRTMAQRVHSISVAIAHMVPSLRMEITTPSIDVAGRVMAPPAVGDRQDEAFDCGDDDPEPQFHGNE